MDANRTNPISEQEKTQIRAGYYKKHNKAISESDLNSLSQSDINFYKNFRGTNWREIGESVLGFMLYFGIIGALVVLPGVFSGDDSTSTKHFENSSASVNCDSNYSPCVPKVGYDLDCSDIDTSVTVIGTDVHGFDGDDDGYGCELN